MSARKPQVPKSHENDDSSYRNLTELFKPSLITDERGVVSKREYGIDFKVKLVDEKRELIGAEFAVQSKTVESREITGRRLKCKLKMTTARYLMDYPLPVLLHAYDWASDTAYWLWLKPYFEKNRNPRWETQKSLTIAIPKSNVLNPRAVIQIRADALKEYSIMRLRNQASLATRIDPDFSYIFEEGDSWSKVTVRAKHQNALKNHPIQLDLTLDKTNNRKLTQALEAGHATTLIGMIRSEGVPDWLMTDESSEHQIVLMPVIPDMSSHMAFEIQDDKGNTLLRLPHIEMRLVQNGIALKVWQGKHPIHPILITLRFDRNLPSTQFNISFAGQNDNPTHLSQYWSVLDQMNGATRVRYTNLDTEQQGTFGPGKSYDHELREEEKAWRKLAKALSNINRKLGIDIRMPPAFTTDDLAKAETASSFLDTGMTTDLIPLFEEDTVIRVETTAGHIRATISDLDRANREGIDLKLPTSGIELELFDHRLDLGPAEDVCSNCKLRGDIESLRKLISDDVEDAEGVFITFDFDPHQIVTRSLKWPQD